jgi:hypothetical protein
MFDRLVLVESGRVAYDGNVSDVVKYFSDAGYEAGTSYPSPFRH